VKNRGNNLEEAKLSFFEDINRIWRYYSFYSNFLRILTTFGATRNELDKVVIVGGSNNAGVWRLSPQPPEVNGVLEAEPPTLRQFFTVFSKKYAFYAYIGLNFCLKCIYK